MRVYRHGDIMFREVSALPKGTVKELGSTFEQHGETGKMHTVVGVRVVEIDYRKFLMTPAVAVPVTHPEHPIEWLPPDTILEVSRVRSVTPYMD